MKSQSFSCNRCGAPSPTPTPASTPTPEPPPPPPGECNQFPSVCDPPDGWSWEWCCCVNDYLLNNGSWPCTDTPIIIDTDENGLNLSDAEHGVAFDLDANGSLDNIGWPLDPDDKLLVYDRNGNGNIDDAKELFGNKTPQPDSPSGWLKTVFWLLQSSTNQKTAAMTMVYCRRRTEDSLCSVSGRIKTEMARLNWMNWKPYRLIWLLN